MQDIFLQFLACEVWNYQVTIVFFCTIGILKSYIFWGTSPPYPHPTSPYCLIEPCVVLCTKDEMISHAMFKAGKSQLCSCIKQHKSQWSNKKIHGTWIYKSVSNLSISFFFTFTWLDWHCILRLYVSQFKADNSGVKAKVNST